MRLVFFARAQEEDVSVFASNLVLSIPVQNLFKRFLDMFIKVFKVTNTGREIRE